MMRTPRAEPARARIERIELFVTDLASRLTRRIASGDYDTGGRGTLAGKPILIKIYAGGVVGIGQIRPIAPSHFMPDTVQSILAAIAEFYGPRLIGTELANLALHWELFDRTLPQNANARALLDIAMHDALGKIYGVPVYKLLGGLCQSTIPLEWSIGMADDIGSVVHEARRAVDEFQVPVLCVKAGDPRGWQHDVKVFQAVRASVGEAVQIGIDPNCAWTVSETKSALRALFDDRLDYLEQPIARSDVAGLAEIRGCADGVPLMADESVMSVEDALDLAKHRAVDVFCIKLYKVGGLRRAKQIASIAEASGIRVNVGGLAVFSQLEAAAGAHFYASTPARQMMPAAEFIFGLGVAGEDALCSDEDGRFRVSNGHVVPPEGPGLGIVLDESALQKFTLLHEKIQ